MPQLRIQHAITKTQCTQIDIFFNLLKKNVLLLPDAHHSGSGDTWRQAGPCGLSETCIGTMLHCLSPRSSLLRPCVQTCACLNCLDVQPCDMGFLGTPKEECMTQWVTKVLLAVKSVVGYHGQIGADLLCREREGNSQVPPRSPSNLLQKMISGGNARIQATYRTLLSPFKNLISHHLQSPNRSSSGKPVGSSKTHQAAIEIILELWPRTHTHTHTHTHTPSVIHDKVYFHTVHYSFPKLFCWYSLI